MVDFTSFRNEIPQDHRVNHQRGQGEASKGHFNNRNNSLLGGKVPHNLSLIHQNNPEQENEDPLGNSLRFSNASESLTSSKSPTKALTARM
jgi:hypothetical protein